MLDILIEVVIVLQILRDWWCSNLHLLGFNTATVLPINKCIFSSLERIIWIHQVMIFSFVLNIKSLCSKVFINPKFNIIQKKLRPFLIHFDMLQYPFFYLNPLFLVEVCSIKKFLSLQQWKKIKYIYIPCIDKKDFEYE